MRTLTLAYLVPVKDLDFGFADAREYQTDKQVERFKTIYFPDTTQINQLKNEPAYFVIGDKGTGKTALATYFINGMDPDVTGVSVFLQKEDFTRFYGFASQQKEFDPSDFGEMWKTVFSLLICFRSVRDVKNNGVDIPDNVSIFFDALQKLSFNSFDMTVFSAFKILFSQIRATSKAFLNSDYLDPSHFSFYLRAMQSYLLNIFEETPLSDRRTFIFVDGLDVRPSEGTGSHEEHIVNVTGLINAMYQMNHDGLTSKRGRVFRVVVLVRPDIFEKLELQNVNNIWRTNTIQISYEVRFRTYKESKLFKLSDNILYTQQDFFPRPDYRTGECWDKYLPDEFIRIPSVATQEEKKEDSFIGILRNTFNRPRDIIYYLNYWKLISVSRKEGNSAYFDPEYTRDYKFRDYFNDYLLGEIRDSLAFYTDVSNYIVFLQFFHHLEPRLPKEKRESTRRLGDVYEVRRPYFSNTEYIETHREYKEYLLTNGITVPTTFEKPELFLQLLYELGLVMFRAPGATKVIWKTYAHAKAAGDFRPQVKLNGEYRLHGGLARAIYKDFM